MRAVGKAEMYALISAHGLEDRPDRIEPDAVAAPAQNDIAPYLVLSTRSFTLLNDQSAVGT